MKKTALWCGVAMATVTFGFAPAGAAPTAPATPTITSAKPVVQGLAITFRKPAGDGGGRVYDYRVICVSSDGGVKAVRKAEHSPINVRGISVGRHYTCTVKARNAGGLGPASEPSDELVPRPEPSRPLPGAPTDVTLQAQADSIVVSFGHVAMPTPALIANTYRARCASTDGGVTRRERRLWTQARIEVHHLTPGKTYTCTVAARNVVGWGPESEPSDEVVTQDNPQTEPGAPVVRSATAIVRGVKITFTKPAPDAGTRIFNYRVTCASSDGGVTVERSIRRSPITVHGMSVGKTYTCTVRARNAQGLGVPSEPSDPVAPLAK